MSKSFQQLVASSIRKSVRDVNSERDRIVSMFAASIVDAHVNGTRKPKYEDTEVSVSGNK